MGRFVTEAKLLQNYPLDQVDFVEFACRNVVSKLDVCKFVLSNFFLCNVAGTLPENTNPKQTVPQQVMQARGHGWPIWSRDEWRSEGWVFSLDGMVLFAISSWVWERYPKSFDIKQLGCFIFRKNDQHKAELTWNNPPTLPLKPAAPWPWTLLITNLFAGLESWRSCLAKGSRFLAQTGWGVCCLEKKGERFDGDWLFLCVHLCGCVSYLIFIVFGRVVGNGKGLFLTVEHDRTQPHEEDMRSISDLGTSAFRTSEQLLGPWFFHRANSLTTCGTRFFWTIASNDDQLFEEQKASLQGGFWKETLKLGLSYQLTSVDRLSCGGGWGARSFFLFLFSSLRGFGGNWFSFPSSGMIG